MTELYVFHGSLDAAPYAVVDGDGNVVNIIQWDGVTPYDPGDEMRLVPHDPAVHVFEPTITLDVPAEPFMTAMPDAVSMAEAHIDPVVAETPKKRRWWSRNKG